MLLGVDVGGTFTDAVLLDGGDVHTAKVPTTPGEESLGVMRGVEAVLRRAFPGFRGAFHAGLAAADVAGWDSVAHVNLLMDLEDAFGVEIPPGAAAQVPDVGGLMALVRERLPG